MDKAFLITVVVLVHWGCVGSSPPIPAGANEFTVVSEQSDPQTATTTVDLKIKQPVTDKAVQLIAESMIAARRGRFSRITVRSYLDGTAAGNPPFAVSTLLDGSITHRFNSAASQRIPTH